ncbi:MAG: hypothetical protein H6R23_2859 [Proteobacteria bacterium]|nr:hypothetical protein [Pseudomonadota bacterium]
MTSELYTLQEFSDTAKRRVREARALLDHPPRQKQRDGAVMLALLAAECALKRWFRGTTGHDLQILWKDQSASQRDLAGPRHSDAVSKLHQANPYAYRYGKKKPVREHAASFVDHAEVLVEWMKDIIGIQP